MAPMHCGTTNDDISPIADCCQGEESGDADDFNGGKRCSVVLIFEEDS